MTPCPTEYVVFPHYLTPKVLYDEVDFLTKFNFASPSLSGNNVSMQAMNDQVQMIEKASNPDWLKVTAIL